MIIFFQPVLVDLFYYCNFTPTINHLVMPKSNMRTILVNALIIIFTFFVLSFIFSYSTYLLLNFVIENKILYLFFAFRLALIIAAIYLISFLLYKKVIKPKIKAVYKNLSLTISTIIIFILILEGIFMFIPISHNAGYSLASVNWHYYFWKPLNKFGYRDKEHDLEKIKTKKKVFVLGDSVTAGDGIKKVKNRYSDVLSGLFPDNYELVNLGLRGSETKDEYERLRSYPLKPEILILQYYMNDFEQAAVSYGKDFSVAPYNTRLKKIIANSYFLNFIYWTIPQKDISNEYSDFLVSSFESSSIRDQHLRDLYSFIKISKDKNFELVVMLVPNLSRQDISNKYLPFVEKLFTSNNIPVLNVSDLIVDMKMHKRIVNKNDGHPSIIVNKMMAAELYKLLVSENLLN